MTNKQYDILLENEKIGTTELEKGDAPMGVVLGKIIFTNINSGYNFFRSYCLKNDIEFTDYPEDKLITTEDIPNLQVITSNGNKLIGQSWTTKLLKRFETSQGLYIH